MATLEVRAQDMKIWDEIERILREAPAIDVSFSARIEMSPWAFCLLIALVRHRERQEFVADVARRYLGVDLAALSQYGGGAHPDEQEGIVPGLPEWKYFFHGCGLALTHRESGETIDVDFTRPDGNAEWIDPFFYSRYLQSASASGSKGAVEADLLRLHPSGDTVKVSLKELVDLKLLELDWRVRATPETNAHGDALRAIGERWLANKEISPAAYAERRAWVAKHSTDGYGVRAFAEANPSDAELRVYLTQVLATPELSGRTSSALSIIRARDDASYCDVVWALFRRINPKGEIPQPHLWSECAKFLLRFDREAEAVLATLPDVGGTEVGEAALLALEYAPALGRPLFRKALRSQVPHAREVAAAILSLLTDPWAMTELEAVLDESTDEEATAASRAALKLRGDPNQRAARWETQHLQPERNREEMLTVTDLMLNGTADRISFEADRLRPRVARLLSIPN